VLTLRGGGDEPGMCTALRFLPATTARDAQNVAIIASSSGRIWHWHATSGQCLGARSGDPIVEVRLHKKNAGGPMA
jgi:hypothetical protein